MSDFPETPNLFSLANSLMATILPTNLLGGVTLGGASGVEIATNLGLLATLGTPSTAYSTLVPNDLPLLEPLRLPSRIANFVLGKLGVQAKLGTPLADALQPALSILVNTGYTDVVLPGQGGTYNRTFNDQGTYTQFMTKAVLTPKQWLQVPGDVVRALVVGFQDQFPILRFGRPAPTLVPDGDHLKISYAPAPPVTPVAATETSVPSTPTTKVAKAPAAVKPVAAEPGTSPTKAAQDDASDQVKAQDDKSDQPDKKAKKGPRGKGHEKSSGKDTGKKVGKTTEKPAPNKVAADKDTADKPAA